MTDSIVQEVREARASIAAEFGYDLSKYLVWIREQTKLRKEVLANANPNIMPQVTSGVLISPVKRKRRASSVATAAKR